MGSLRLEGLGALAKQAAALGQDAKKSVNSALLKGARIITAEAKVRAAAPVAIESARMPASASAARKAGLSGRNSSPVPTSSSSTAPAGSANSGASDSTVISSGVVTRQMWTPEGSASTEPRCVMPAKAKPPRPYPSIEWRPGAKPS